MWHNKKVSVVLTSYNEKDSIRETIDGFFKTGVVDEVVVVDNNAEPGSIEEVRKTRARLVFEKKQGHGHALQKGMREAAGDYVILCEGDGTFNPADVYKFLSYGDEFPVVLGTRTNTSLIDPGTGMFYLRRIADVLEAKLIEYLFWTDTLTDVGCTYKLLRREVIKNLETKWIKGDSHFVTEITLHVASRNIPFVEIPVAFRKRTGKSAVTGKFSDVAKWGVKLLVFILVFWVKMLLEKIGRKKNYDCKFKLQNL